MSLHNRKSMEPWIKDNVHYYDHQVDGIRKMAMMRSVLLADEMGLGKSLQALTVFAIDVVMNKKERCLIVCPASLKRNWAEEIEKFTGFKATVVSNSSTKPIREKVINGYLEDSGPRILILNYEQVKSHLDILKRVDWGFLILDEAHMIKNHKAGRTKAIHSLSAHRSLVLTGSPILNHVNELWSLLERVAPGEWGTYWKFVNRYAVFGGFENRQITGIKHEGELKFELEKVMLRRLKKDVLDLPEIQFIERIVDLTPLQRKMYDEVVNDLQLTIGEGSDPVEINNALTKFLKLKQICGTTATVREDEKDESFKLDAALWDAESLIEQGERIVAFTQFRGVQEAYVKRLTKRSNWQKVADKTFPIFVLNGDVPPDDRQDVVNAWANSEVPGIIVCMFQVAGVGLNMTAARYGQFLDKLFVPKLNQQATDRMHRIGANKTHPVQILEYLCKNTAEERVEKILKTKEKVFNSIIEDDAFVSKIIADVMAKEAKGVM